MKLERITLKLFIYIFIIGAIFTLAILASRFTTNENRIQGNIVQDLRDSRGVPIKIQDSTISIGILTPLTGNYAFIGNEAKIGLESAKTKLASKNIDVRLVYKDTECDAITTLVRIQELKDEGVRYVIAPDCTGYPHMLSDDEGILTILSIPSNEEPAFTIAPQIKSEVDTVLSYMRPVPATLSVIYVNDNYGRAYLDAIKKQFPGRLRSTYAYDLGEIDYSSLSMKIVENKPEAIWIVAWSAEDLSSILATLRSNEYLNQAFANIAPKFSNKEAIEGLIFTSNIDITSGRTAVKELLSDYELSAYTSPTAITVNSYDALLVISKLIKEHPENPGEYLYTLTNFEGAGGFISMKGYTSDRKPYVQTIKEGKITSS